MRTSFSAPAPLRRSDARSCCPAAIIFRPATENWPSQSLTEKDAAHHIVALYEGSARFSVGFGGHTQ